VGCILRHAMIQGEMTRITKKKPTLSYSKKGAVWLRVSLPVSNVVSTIEQNSGGSKGRI
jgi:hypothetical protein